MEKENEDLRNELRICNRKNEAHTAEVEHLHRRNRFLFLWPFSYSFLSAYISLF